jgi:ABC-type multidrug transport system fused ATPase/permease subunit
MSPRLILPTPLIFAFSIRSFNQQSIFIKANQRHIDRNQICYLPSISVNRWLSIRLEIVGAVIILVVAVLAMVALITTGVDAGLVGLVLSYAMNATSSLVCCRFSIFLLDFTADPIELGG